MIPPVETYFQIGGNDSASRERSSYEGKNRFSRGRFVWFVTYPLIQNCEERSDAAIQELQTQAFVRYVWIAAPSARNDELGVVIRLRLNRLKMAAEGPPFLFVVLNSDTYSN